MASKITLEELQKKIGDPRIDEKSLRRYFVMDEARSGAFEPVLQLNPETVKVEETPEGRARGEMLLSGANRLARLRRRWAFEAKISEGYAGPIIVSEGDSWFQFPILLDDTIDNLARDYAIRSLDAAGDTLEKGKDLDSVREDLAKADPLFKRAAEAAQLAQVTFKDTLDARALAEKAEAAKYVPKDWAKVEQSLTAAAGELEGGNLDKATKSAHDVTADYKAVEAKAVNAKAKAAK